MTQAEIYTAVPEHLPKNFPFYNWVPKPLGIAFLIILFMPTPSTVARWWEGLASSLNI
mgnify:CR=1 FL=1